MGVILSINTGIGSSIGVFKEGKAVFCVEEERFSRIKNTFGFPKLALQYILDKGIVSKKSINTITLTNATATIADRNIFYGWFDHCFDTGRLNNESVIKKRLRKAMITIRETKLYAFYSRMRHGKNKRDEDSIRKILADFGLGSIEVICVEHHTCHAAAVYYGLAKEVDKKYLVFTLDGGGDSLTSTVSIGSHGKLERISSTGCYSIGDIYSAVTYYLGFTPHEHEYKLMGLAPYVSPKYVEKYKSFFARYLSLKDDDTVFYNPMKLDHAIMFEEMIRELHKSRFDNIAAGLQAFTEEIVLRWIKGNIKKHGIVRVLCSGGVFMNVKLNKLISELAGLDYVDVFPSCGDESNIFGAAYYTHCNNAGWTGGLLEKFTLGSSPADVLEAMEQYKDKVVAEKHENIAEYAAQQLAIGKVIARCTGAMEFGARALGNRSILANPANLNTVNKINQMIKRRDFWMPFAPAVLVEKADTLVDIPSSLKLQQSPYMMFAFGTKADKREQIVCGVHQADHTARAQIVTSEKYPEFHEIISKFNALTGIPCLLNTSFNLHGYPIVENAKQAIAVLLASQIDLLVIDNYSIRIKG